MKMLERNLPSNYSVRVWYFRSKGEENGAFCTRVKLIKDNCEIVGYAHSVAHPKKEKHPSRKMGRAIAVGRAMAQHFRNH